MPPRAAYLDRDGQAHARGMGEPKISDQIRQCRHRVFASRRQIAVPSPTKILAAIEVEGCIFVPAILDVQTEFLVNMKAAAHELAPEKEHVHGHQTVPSDLALRVKALESLLVEKGLELGTLKVVLPDVEIYGSEATEFNTLGKALKLDWLQLLLRRGVNVKPASALTEEARWLPRHRKEASISST
jgi:hypothetical protein